MAGVGRTHMEAAGRWASSKGATGLELNIWEVYQGAMAFYESLGFATARRKMVIPLDRFAPP